MSYFHVVIKTKSDDSWKCCLKDINEEKLIELFIKPYKKGNKIIVEGEVVSTKKINHVVISKTHKNHKEELENVRKTSEQYFKEMNKNSTVRIMSPGYGLRNYEIKDCGENVTSYYLTNGAGEEGFMNNPWVITIGGGLVVGGILLLLS